MDPAVVDVDELIEFWTLLEIDREQLIGKRGATALGFALLLKHYSRHGRFPRGHSDLHDRASHSRSSAAHRAFSFARG